MFADSILMEDTCASSLHPRGKESRHGFVDTLVVVEISLEDSQGSTQTTLAGMFIGMQNSSLPPEVLQCDGECQHNGILMQHADAVPRQYPILS